MSFNSASLRHYQQSCNIHMYYMYIHNTIQERCTLQSRDRDGVESDVLCIICTQDDDEILKTLVLQQSDVNFLTS